MAISTRAQEWELVWRKVGGDAKTTTAMLLRKARERGELVDALCGLVRSSYAKEPSA